MSNLHHGKNNWWRHKKKSMSIWFSKPTFKHWTAFLFICLTSIILILLSQYVFTAEEIKIDGSKKESLLHHVCRDIGIALFPIGLISLIYEFVLRENFIDHMKDAIDDRMPESYQRIRDSGVVDVYPNLEISQRKKDLTQLSDGSEIRILDIWMENLDVIEEEITSALIEKSCTFKIILWNPNCPEPLRRRAKSLRRTDYFTIVGNIMNNLSVINSIRHTVFEHFRTLEDYEQNKEIYAKRFEAKLYDCFIGVPLISYAQEYYMGTYLRDSMSSHRTQFKIRDDKTFFYKELDRHFSLQWNDESNIVLDEKKYEEMVKWYRSRVWDVDENGHQQEHLQNQD